MLALSSVARPVTAPPREKYRKIKKTGHLKSDALYFSLGGAGTGRNLYISLNDFAAYGIFVQQEQYRRTALAKIYGQKNCPAVVGSGCNKNLMIFWWIIPLREKSGKSPEITYLG